MKAEIQHDIEPALQAAITAGRYRSIDQFVDAAIREKLTLDQAVDGHYAELAQKAIDAGGFATEALCEQVRRDRVAQQLRTAVEAGRASDEPISMTGDQFRTRFRSQREDHLRADQA